MKQKITKDPRKYLFSLFESAVNLSMPDFLSLGINFPQPQSGKVIVVGAGKGASSMARSFEIAAKKLWSSADYQKIIGLVVTRYGHGLPCDRIQVVEASHPVPDAAGQEATRAIVDLIENLNKDDLVIFLVSGGGSSLLCLPVDGVSFEEKQAINKSLLRSGASIFEINCVRKHLSRIKGGRLAELCYPAKVLTFAISDIPGDDVAIIASGPTLPDESSCDDALSIIDRYKIQVSSFIRNGLSSGDLETPKMGSSIFKYVSKPVVLATAEKSLEGVRLIAEDDGCNVMILSDSIEGEAQQVGSVLGAMAKWINKKELSSERPVLLLSGGETTVTVNGHGRGGRNTEFLLSFASTVNGLSGIYALAADTDGIDGSEDNAGALYGPDTFQKARAAGLNLNSCLLSNDSYSYFHATGDLLITGPTRTNVNDFRAILII